MSGRSQGIGGAVKRFGLQEVPAELTLREAEAMFPKPTHDPYESNP